MMKYIFYIALALLISKGFSAVAEDEVTSLPGWNGTLPSKMYAGFIDAGNET